MSTYHVDVAKSTASMPRWRSWAWRAHTWALAALAQQADRKRDAATAFW